MLKKIIDLSEHQGTIDFAQVKNEVEGVIIRLSMGYTNEDTVYRLDKKALEYISQCDKYGIPWGVYHYSYCPVEDALQGAKAEAKGVHKILQKLAKQGLYPTLPVYIDMEDNRDLPNGDHNDFYTPNWEARTLICEVFCETLEKLGYYAGVYASLSWFEQMGDLSRFTKWVANWHVAEPRHPCDLWQYTNSGKIAGITTQVDLNYAFLDFPQIIKDTKLNNYEKKQESFDFAGTYIGITKKPATTKPKNEAKEVKEKAEDGFISLKIGGQIYRFNKKGELVND